MKRRSFQNRLALLASTVSGVILLAFGVAVWLVMKEQFIKSVDLRIALPAERLSRHFNDPNRWKSRLEREWDSSWASEPGTPRILLVLDKDANELYRAENSEWLLEYDLSEFLPTEEELAKFDSLDFRPPPPREGPKGFKGKGGSPRFDDRPPGPGKGPPRPVPPITPHLPPGFFTATDPQGTDWRVVSIANPVATLFTGAPLAHFERELNRMRDYLFAFIPFALIAIGGSGWLISRRALRPLERISETASHVTAKGLDERIPVTDKDFSEFSQLVEVLNDMMVRLEGSFHQATRFTADASHELKTPIALMQAEVETALKECEPGSPEQSTLLHFSEEIQRLKRIIQSLLLLSQADSGHLQLSPEEMNLSAECEALAEDAEVLCESASLTLRHKIEPGLTVTADKVLLMQAVQNLLTNAVKYNCENGEVFFSLSSDNGDALLQFSNNGDPIPPEERERIFERFYRLDPSRQRAVDGFGLGLNLAQEIVRAHSGTLRLLDDKDGLTTFRIRLPIKGN